MMNSVADMMFHIALARGRYTDPLSLARFQTQVYSQNGEDGIIAEIFHRIITPVGFRGQSASQERALYAKVWAARRSCTRGTCGLPRCSETRDGHGGRKGYVWQASIQGWSRVSTRSTQASPYSTSTCGCCFATCGIRKYAAMRLKSISTSSLNGYLCPQNRPVRAQKSNSPWDRFADEACGRRCLIIRPKR